MSNVLAFFSALLKVIIIFFAPIKGIILIVALSTIVDTGFGLWRCWKTSEDIKSKVLRNGLVPKLLSYVAAVMLVYISDFFILNDLISSVVSIQFLSTKLIALVLLSIEVKSMDENFKVVKGYSFIQRIVSILNKAKNFKKEIQE